MTFRNLLDTIIQSIGLWIKYRFDKFIMNNFPMIKHKEEE